MRFSISHHLGNAGPYHPYYFIGFRQSVASVVIGQIHLPPLSQVVAKYLFSSYICQYHSSIYRVQAAVYHQQATILDTTLLQTCSCGFVQKTGRSMRTIYPVLYV